MARFEPGVYRAVLAVRAAYPFDIAGLLMRFYSYMMSIGTVSMLSLAGYSFMTSGIVASVISLAIFLISPRISKLIDERGQSRILPKAAFIVVAGLIAMLSNVALKGPDWVFFPAALLMGCIPNAQALVRARWTYLIRAGKITGIVPSIRTVFSFEGVLDDLAFMISPPVSIALASGITPIAGLLAGGVAFIAGVSIMTCAHTTEPEVGWSDAEENIEKSEASRAVEGQGRSATARPKSIIRTSAAVRILFVLMFLTGAFYGVFDTSSIAFAEGLGNPNIASAGLMASALLSAIVGFLFGMIRLNISMHKQLTIAAVTMGLAYGTQMLISTEIGFYAVSLLGALTYAPFLITSNSAVERAVPGKRLTEAITWVNSGMTCGVALGPTIAGIIIDLFGAERGFDVGGCIALSITLLTLLCAGIIRKNVRNDTYEVRASSK